MLVCPCVNFTSLPLIMPIMTTHTTENASMSEHPCNTLEFISPTGGVKNDSISNRTANAVSIAVINMHALLTFILTKFSIFQIYGNLSI